MYLASYVGGGGHSRVSERRAVVVHEWCTDAATVAAFCSVNSVAALHADAAYCMSRRPCILGDSFFTSTGAHASGHSIGGENQYRVQRKDYISSFTKD